MALTILGPDEANKLRASWGDIKEDHLKHWHHHHHHHDHHHHGKHGGVCPVLAHAAEYASGFFAGAKLGEYDPKVLYDCLKREKHADELYVHGFKDLWGAIKYHSPQFGVKGLDEMAFMMLDMVKETSTTKDGKKYATCFAVDYNKNNNWTEFKKIFAALTDKRKTFQFNGKSIYFNGKDFNKSAYWLAKTWESQDFKKFGWLLAHEMDVAVNAPQPCPVLLHGSEFASGFLYGAKVGGYDSKLLYKCLEKEEKADMIYHHGFEDLWGSIKAKNPKQGIKGLDEMVYFTYDMLAEKSKTKSGKVYQTCYAVDYDKKANWKNYVGIIKALKDEKKTLQFDGKHFMFNGKNFDKPIYYLAETWK